MPEQVTKRLFRSPTDRMIAGVCGGFAEYFGVDSTIVRVLWLLSLFAGGVGFWMYIAAWVIVPERAAEAGEVRRSGGAGVLIGIALVLIGLAWLGHTGHFFGFYYPPYWPEWDARWRFGWWWGDVGDWLPILIIAAGVAYIVYLLTRGKEATTPPQTPMEGPASEGPRAEAAPSRRLYRVRQGRMIAGVCTGLADHFHTDPNLIRLLWVLGTVLTSLILGIVAYIVMAIVVPERPESPAATAQTGE